MDALQGSIMLCLPIVGGPSQSYLLSLGHGYQNAAKRSGRTGVTVYPPISWAGGLIVFYRHSGMDAGIQRQGW